MDINYGIVSTSSIAPRFIDAVRRQKAGNIVAVSSRSLEKAKEKANEWQIPKAYGNYLDLIDDSEVNVVYVSSVNSEHYAVSKAALLAGKHVVCEKPCTVSKEKTNELFDIAKEKGLFLIEAQKMLFLPVIDKVKNIIESGLLGEVTMVEMSHSFSAAYNEWMYDKALGGGPLLSSGIYAFELILHLFGDIKRAEITKSSMPNGVEWQYIVTGETESGVLFAVKNSTKAVLDNTAHIFGTKGYLDIPSYWKARKAVVHLAGSDPEIIEFPSENEMVYEVLHIKDCLLKGLPTSPVVTRELTVKGISVIEGLSDQKVGF